jgi:hypothetical protein
MSPRFIAAAFEGYFWILRKFLPISLELEWFCTLALKSKPPDFLQKLFLDSQYVISSLNRWRKNETPHCVGASGSFRASSFHVGPKSNEINSKKSKKYETFAWRHFMWPRCGKKIKPWKKIFNRKSLHKNDLSEFDDNNNKCDTSILYLGVWWQ